MIFIGDTQLLCVGGILCYVTLLGQVRRELSRNTSAQFQN